MTTFALADEPGWYLPRASPERYTPWGPSGKPGSGAAKQAEWQQFLIANNLQPSDFGKSTWAQLTPKTDRWPQPTTTGAKKLFYWSARFSSFSSAAAFSRATAALEAVFYKGVPIYVNFNNFHGRGWVPGPVGNNVNRTSSNAAMLALDWMEFGRQRGSTLLWTEDWFSDAAASQWPYYIARLRAAASLAPAPSDVQVGGYIVPRSAGDGIAMKILSVVGSGGKALKYFVFGPEYNFPSNCYSEKLIGDPAMLKAMAGAHGMIGAAENLLWPGTRAKSKVAIVYPRSSFYWDLADVPLPRTLMDCTNTNMLTMTAYTSEIFGLFRAIQQDLNYPIDFIDEDSLADGTTLAHYKTVFITAPNVPAAGSTALVAWAAKTGGLLVTVVGAGQFDEYNDPSTTIATAAGIHETRSERPIGEANATGIRNMTCGNASIVVNVSTTADARTRAAADDMDSMSTSGHSTTNIPGSSPFVGCLATGCHFQIRGECTNLTVKPASNAAVVAVYDNGLPAAVWSAVGKGAILHTNYLPGITMVMRTTNQQTLNTTRAFFDNITASYAGPPPVSITAGAAGERAFWVESPLLSSAAGSVVTLLNWNWNFSDPAAQPVDISMNTTLGFTPTKVVSVAKGPLKATRAGPGVVQVSLPLEANDFVLFYR